MLLTLIFATPVRDGPTALGYWRPVQPQLDCVALVSTSCQTQAQCNNDTEAIDAVQLALAHGCHAHVFSKGVACAQPPGFGFPGVHCELKRNVGREFGNLLDYIVEHYDNLPKRLINVPMPLHSHARRPLYLDVLNTTKDFLCSEGGPMRELGNFTFRWYSGFPAGSMPAKYVIPAKVEPMEKFSSHYLGRYDPEEKMCLGGLFGTSRHLIRQRPRRTYEQLQAEVNVGDTVEAGHFMEHLARVAFGGV
ncbi:hypothetical protein AB1Y20_008261 [Prymnesium parvum]|uniref:Uncharacterized protein n=1 Tax=Prymnesium parvum TaxID=97485 RepID=A0AB34IT61_PRYPA